MASQIPFCLPLYTLQFCVQYDAWKYAHLCSINILPYLGLPLWQRRYRSWSGFFCGSTKFAKINKHFWNDTKAWWLCALNLIQLTKRNAAILHSPKEVAFTVCLSLSRPLWSFLPLEIIIILTCIHLLVLKPYRDISSLDYAHDLTSKVVCYLKMIETFSLLQKNKQHGLVDCVPNQ